MVKPELADSRAWRSESAMTAGQVVRDETKGENAMESTTAEAKATETSAAGSVRVDKDRIVAELYEDTAGYRTL